MKTGRLLCVAMVICVLFAVCGADQANMDAFQLKRRTEGTAAKPVSKDGGSGKDAEGGHAAERTGEDSEKQRRLWKDLPNKIFRTFYTPVYMESPWPTEMVEAQSEVLDGYAAFLTEYAAEQKEGGEKPSVFTLIFLDGDDAPELVVMDGDTHLCDAFVYQFEEGRVVPVGSYGQYGTLFYREKEGIVLDSYDSFGDVYDDVYQIEGNQITHLQSFSERAEISEAEGEWLDSIYTVDGKEVSWEQYQKVRDQWYEADYKEITYDMCQTFSEIEIREELQEELEVRISTQKEVLKNNLLIAAGAHEDNILMFDYDDYDGDGNYEAFMIVGNIFEGEDGNVYHNEETLCFAGADGCILGLNTNGGYRAMDGKMDFGTRRYLFFDMDYNFTANISEVWTVRDGKPVEEGERLQHGEVSYRGGDDFIIWVDAYDNYCVKDHWGPGDDMWWGHTWKPYFYHYNGSHDRLEAYAGEIISGEEFSELSETNIIAKIENEGYTVGEIIRWENDIVTINYHDVTEEEYHYENVIWDNNVKDFWRKDERGVTSWRGAGEGGSYGL